MAKYMLVVGMNLEDPSTDSEFNEWYNHTHFPDVLETNGFVRATRWQHTNPGDKDAKYLALYEIETDNIQETMKALDDTITKKRAEGRMSSLGVPVIMGTYQNIFSMEQ
jgi:hypothetical protein